MRELLWQIEELNNRGTGIAWNVLGYVDVKPQWANGISDIFAGNIRCPYLGDDAYLLARRQETNVAISVGEPKLRKRIAEKLLKNPNLKFPNLIMDNTRICSDTKMGQGCIISMGGRVSTNVKIGDFVFLNMGTLVCHDGSIGDFSTLSPDVKLAGQVTVGRECDLGLGTRVIQGIIIGDQVVTGAGSVVVRDVEGSCTVVGVPAKSVAYSV